MKLRGASWIALTFVVFATFVEVSQALPMLNSIAAESDLETNLHARYNPFSRKKKSKKGEASTSTHHREATPETTPEASRHSSPADSPRAYSEKSAKSESEDEELSATREAANAQRYGDYRDPQVDRHARQIAAWPDHNHQDHRRQEHERLARSGYHPIDVAHLRTPQHAYAHQEPEFPPYVPTPLHDPEVNPGFDTWTVTTGGWFQGQYHPPRRSLRDR